MRSAQVYSFFINIFRSQMLLAQAQQSGHTVQFICITGLVWVLIL